MMRYDAKKIIHVMVDEKFNDMAIRQFEEAAPGIHEYWIVATDLHLTKSVITHKCTFESLVAQFSRSDIAGIVFHSLPSNHYILLRQIPHNVRVVWIGYGYDYYSLLNHENESTRVLAKTKVLQAPSHKRHAKRLLRPIWNKIRSFKNEGSISDLQRVDYFSPVLDIEYDLVLRHIPLRAKYITWNYGTAEDDFSQLDMANVNGSNILAGNSASATNNHAELFELIRDQVDLTERKVIVPLSYGDPYYRDQVIKKGEKLLGKAFLPLTTFMPKEEYSKTIQACGFVMMNHLRQQALGNICMAMLMGAKIYLNGGNPLSSWIKSRGAVFGSINKLDMIPFQEDDKESNRRLVYSHWGRDHQLQKTKHLVDTILSSSTH